MSTQVQAVTHAMAEWDAAVKSLHMMCPGPRIGAAQMAEQLRRDLETAKAYIADPARWCQKQSALFDVETGKLIANCAVGAVARACRAPGIDRETNRYVRAVAALNDQLPSWFRNVPALNDNSTHAGVMDLFDKTLAAVAA